MKIRGTSDWRDNVAFETPVVASELVPGDPSRCAGCPGGSDARPREELWAVKLRHPHNHAGYVQFYCSEHVPTFQRKQTQEESHLARAAARRERTATPRRPTIEDTPPRAMCPECFVEVSALGVCGMCGSQVA